MGPESLAHIFIHMQSMQSCWSAGLRRAGFSQAPPDPAVLHGGRAITLAKKHRELKLPACMSLSATVPVLMSSWSARVLLPWSMWAMIEKLRILAVGT